MYATRTRLVSLFITGVVTFCQDQTVAEPRMPPSKTGDLGRTNGLQSGRCEMTSDRYAPSPQGAGGFPPQGHAAVPKLLPRVDPRFRPPGDDRRRAPP